MTRTYMKPNPLFWTAALALAMLASVAVSGCSRKPSSAPGAQVAELKTLEIRRVSADLSKPEPHAAYWKEVPEGLVTLMAQPMIAPRPEKTTTEGVWVQAVHDGTRAAFRLRWKDAEKSEAGRLGEFSDAFALEFPLKEGPLPPVMMGAKDMPVHLFHWRAQYQRDREKGKPQMKELYPNLSIDMYPHEFKHAKVGSPAVAEKFSPGVAEGNPQSYVKSGVDEIIAEGFATSAVQKGRGSAGRAEWANGEWALVITRPLAIEGGSTLKVGGTGHVAFAAWQGGQGEVGSRKCVTMQWTPLKVQ